ncbi:MAG: PstS family phosphate ABC transporter substrate-binding protein [Cytophagales bacterium]|nr:PstS family phosphate ABC transporter substrate-binding protein [Bernardetiaceae bacterium]MDW8204632.1 PstS family phosphate ABC transporter substrate-binding protein [Cytophagales bacterium]
MLAQSIKVKGSDTMYPLMHEITDLYGKGVQIEGGGSNAGIQALREGRADVAMASRSLQPTEQSALAQSGQDAVSVVVAYDALSFIVHPENKVSKLSQSQLEGIFNGSITNWKQVGGDNRPIQVVIREATSGTNEFVKDVIIHKKPFPTNAKVCVGTSAVIQTVSQDLNAIGFVGIGYLEEIVKPLAIAANNSNFVVPSFKTALNKTYPLVRPLYLFYPKKQLSKVKPFIDFALSPLGQKAVVHKGFIPAGNGK